MPLADAPQSDPPISVRFLSPASRPEAACNGASARRPGSHFLVQRLWARRSIRAAATAVVFPIIVALSSAVLELADSDEMDAGSVAVFLVPIAVFGAVVARSWVLPPPLLWSALFVAAQRVADLINGTCSICTSDENWGNYPLFFFAIAVGPMTVALLIGVLIGIAVRSVRGAPRRLAR